MVWYDRPEENHDGEHFRENRCMLNNRRTVRIEWGDCDPAGIVYFPRYAEWFDACTAALFEAAGFPKSDLINIRGIGIPMVKTRSEFFLPLRFGEETTVETTIPRLGRSSFDVHHRMLKGVQLAVECFETRVWTRIAPADPKTLKSEPIPQEVRAGLSREAR